MRTYIVVCYFLVVVGAVTPVLSTCQKTQELFQGVQRQLKLLEKNVANCDCPQNDKGLSGRVAFMVYNSKLITNLAAGTVIKFDQIDLNEGQGYNPTTGIFKAPSNGLYYFSWQTNTNPKKYCMTNLSVNGKAIAKAYAHAYYGEAMLDSSSSATAKLNKGDEVCIKVDHGDTDKFYMFGGRWSHFNGFKIL